MRYRLVESATLLIVAFVFSLTGCAELKQLRVENADQKVMIEQLNKDYQICQNTLKETREELNMSQGQLSRTQGELDTMLIELKKKEVKVIQQSEAFTRMQQAMKAELETKQVALSELEGKLTLTMVESILFDSGMAQVKVEGVEALGKVADVLGNIKDQEIIVAGHTDNVQIGVRLARTYPSNWELSAARAISVVKILIAKGVDPEYLSACGYGEYRPVGDNDTPEGRAQNRRMEIILMPKLK
ncbi:MAG: OmpA family protein [Deltaproteobacteria bacterium]|nr:OmpA family protein [Deltaproteobacteria bacterium]